MAQITKIDVQTEIKSSAEKFFDILLSKAYLLPKICPDLIKDVRIVKGDWKTAGSIKQWSYVAGNGETLNETVEAIDEKGKSITYKTLDGVITNYYKNLKSTLQVSTKGDGSLVKWSLEYEKANEDVPTPTKYLDFLVNLTKATEAHILNA